MWDMDDIGFEICIFEEQYLGLDSWNAIDGSIRIWIFKRLVFDSFLWVAWEVRFEFNMYGQEFSIMCCINVY